MYVWSDSTSGEFSIVSAYELIRGSALPAVLLVSSKAWQSMAFLSSHPHLLLSFLDFRFSISWVIWMERQIYDAPFKRAFS